MSIVLIVIPGKQKKEFANELHKKTQNGVDYVIVQKTKYVPWKERFQKLVKTVGWGGLLKEFYYVVSIRLNTEYRNYLNYFFLFTSRENSLSYIPKVLEVENVNSDEVYNLLQKLKPKLLVVWGSNILKPRIYKSAENSINLHMGLGEHYRGAVANHFAILENKREPIGAMIHQIDEKTDTGDVYKIILANTKLAPKEMFTDLNNRAFDELLNISHAIWSGQKLKTFVQNLNKGKNLFLKDWTPSRRFAVATKIKNWKI
jgi:folate-dependent phosphoribosylglycinamide formyltransferase PurN